MLLPYTIVQDGHPVEYYPNGELEIIRDRFSDLSEDYQELAIEWVHKTLIQIDKYSQRTSYGFKHELQEDTGIYMSNCQFKDMMLQLGYKPKSLGVLNWSFRLESRRYVIPEPVNGSFRWYVMKHYKTTKNPMKDFIYDVKHDRNFPDSISYKENLDYLESCDPCSKAMEAFEFLWNKYKEYIKRVMKEEL